MAEASASRFRIFTGVRVTTRFASVVWLRAIVLGLASSLLVYACARHFLPSPSAELLSRHADAAQHDAFLNAFALRTSILEGYLQLMASYLQGNFGDSYVNQLPVGPLLWEKLLQSIRLTLPGLLIGHALALGMAFRFSADGPTRPGMLAQLSVRLLVIVAALGGLLTALLLQLIAVRGFGLPAFGLPAAPLADYLQSVAAPSAAIAFGVAAHSFPIYRVILQNPEHLALQRRLAALGYSALRQRLQALRPLLPAVAGSFFATWPLQLMTGSVVLESIFNVPGFALAGLDAARSADAPMLVAISILSTLAVAFGNGLGQLLQAALDPAARVASGAFDRPAHRSAS